jgi:hypothetical protein
MVDPQPRLVELLVRHVRLPRELLPQIEINSIIEAWHAGLFTACVATALAYEYLEVCSGKLSTRRWQQLQPVVGALLAQARFVPIYFSWRPMSPDPGDEHVIDCAMNARPPVVTANTRDFRLAAQTLGLAVLTPVAFVTRLASV